MAQDKPKYKILASTLEDFQKIEEEILSLPGEVLAQIDKAEFGICGIHCTFTKEFPRDSIKIALPEFATQITDSGETVNCYAGRYFFIMPKYGESVKVTYYFTNRNVTKKENLIKELKEELAILIENKSSQDIVDNFVKIINRIEKI
jgi:hypothetical protein